MFEKPCQHRTTRGVSAKCNVVYQLLSDWSIPIDDCDIKPDACGACSRSQVDPQKPNNVTASIAISTVRRVKIDKMVEVINRYSGSLSTAPEADTRCVLRGIKLRMTECKPCQSRTGQITEVAVYRCPLHSECTLNQTGKQPRIQSCATCRDRQPAYVAFNPPMAPPGLIGDVR